MKHLNRLMQLVNEVLSDDLGFAELKQRMRNEPELMAGLERERSAFPGIAVTGIENPPPDGA